LAVAIAVAAAVVVALAVLVVIPEEDLMSLIHPLDQPVKPQIAQTISHQRHPRGV
jgi:uncharacterized protein (DUF1778 family)